MSASESEDADDRLTDEKADRHLIASMLREDIGEETAINLSFELRLCYQPESRSWAVFDQDGEFVSLVLPENWKSTLHLHAFLKQVAKRANSGTQDDESENQEPTRAAEEDDEFGWYR